MRVYRLFLKKFVFRTYCALTPPASLELQIKPRNRVFSGRLPVVRSFYYEKSNIRFFASSVFEIPYFTRGGFGMGFFWDPNSQIPNPGDLGFFFPRKIPKPKSRKIPNPRDWDFFLSKIPKSQKIPEYCFCI